MRADETRRVWTRELPGGGFVALDVRSLGSSRRRNRYAGALIVERRTPERRVGHTPPVVAAATGQTVDDVVSQLLPTGVSNSWLAAAVLRGDRARQAERLKPAIPD